MWYRWKFTKVLEAEDMNFLTLMCKVGDSQGEIHTLLCRMQILISTSLLFCHAWFGDMYKIACLERGFQGIVENVHGI
jgi:hypothetical protein